MSDARALAARSLDAVFAVLLDRRVRRLRRWSFVVTLPLAGLVAWQFGIGTTLGLVALRLALVVAVALVALRLGGERREAMLDLLMHPKLRRLQRTELEVLSTVPRALWRVVRPHRPRSEWSYHRGSIELPFALALIPGAIAEALAVHLLVPDWSWLQIGLAAVHVYGLIWLLAFALGERVRPHVVSARGLDLRGGAFYRVRVPLPHIDRVAAERKKTGERAGAFEQGGEVLMPARGRVDVVLSLSAPVAVERPIGPPLSATTLRVPADDPEAMVEAIREAVAASHAVAASARPGSRRGLRIGLALAPADLAMELAQPA